MGQNGSALVIAVLIIFALAAMGSVVAMISSVDMKISGNQKTNTEALYAAEAGLSEAVHRLGLPNPTTATIGSWTGNVAISDSVPYDPNWTARIYLLNPGAAPPGSGSNFHTGTFQDLSASYADYSEAGGTENVLTIQHKWEDLDGDGVRDDGEIVRYDASRIPPENFTSGHPIEVVTVTGKAGMGTRRVEAEVVRLPVILRTMGALYIDKALKVTGTPAFCGWNHDPDTPPGEAPMGCFAWHVGADDLPGITTTGDEIDFSGGAWDCEGSPSPTDTSSTNPFFSLAEVLGLSESQVNQLLANADNTSIVDPLNGITYLDGDYKINSAITGEGLLYVDGDLRINGDAQFKGIIYVEGDLVFNGGPWILGTVIVRGKGDFSFAAGGAELLYSSEVVEQKVSSYLPMMRLSWKER